MGYKILDDGVRFYLDDNELQPVRYYTDMLKAVQRVDSLQTTISQWVYTEVCLNGRSLAWCARTLGVTYNTVGNWARKLGLPIPPRGGRQIDEDTRCVSNIPCVKDPSHVIGGVTVRYKRPDGFSAHGRCVLCVRENNKRAAERRKRK